MYDFENARPPIPMVVFIFGGFSMIGSELEQIRQQCGISILDICNALGVSESANLFLSHALNTVDTRLRGYDAPDQNLYLKKCTVVCIIYNMKTGGYVYILASGPMGTLYIGSTTDLVGRIWQHKHKSIKGFTSRYDIDKLVYYEWHDRLENMVLRERQLKKWNRNWKCRLIIQQNPLWQDLYNDVLSGAGYSTE